MNLRFPPLVRRRTCPCPTLTGWLAILLGLVVAIRLSAPALYRFLAVSGGGAGDSLIVEGWLSDQRLEDVRRLFREHDYRTIYVTGGPMAMGSYLSEYKDWATLTHARLLHIGLPADRTIAVPAPPVHKDRTYASALALRRQLDACGNAGGTFTLVTEGTHARRSRLLFRKALGPGRRVESLVLPPEDYDPGAWWHSSAGVRGVIYEGLAYLYTRLWMLTEPGPETTPPFPPAHPIPAGPVPPVGGPPTAGIAPPPPFIGYTLFCLASGPAGLCQVADVEENNRFASTGPHEPAG